MTLSRLRGVIAAAATPLNANLSIDIDRLIEHCGVLLDEGCDGINLLGTTGEATSFSVEERLAAMQALARSKLSLQRFMVGTGAASLADAARLTAAARDLGYAGALVLPPFYYKGIDIAGLEDYFDALIARVGAQDLRLYLYHFPQNSGVPYPLAFVQGLKARYPQQLIGLKDSSGDIAYSATMAADVPDFDVFPSAEGSIVESVKYGFAGCISATVNLTASLASQGWKARGTEAATQAIAAATAIRTVLASYPLIASVKAALAGKYRRAEWAMPMPPLSQLGASQAEELRDRLTALSSGSS